MGGGGSGALGTPGGMGLLGQRMDMYEALNSLSSSRSAREKEILRSNINTTENKKNFNSSKVGTKNGLIASDSTGVSGVGGLPSLTTMHSALPVKSRNEVLNKSLNTVNEFLV